MRTHIVRYTVFAILLLAPVFFSTIHQTSRVSGLSCLAPSPENALAPRAHLDASQYVLVGAVTSTTKTDQREYSGDYLQTFTVSDWVKGSTGESEVTIKTNATWGAALPEDQTMLLVYKSATLADDKYNTSGTTEFSAPLCPEDNKSIIATLDVDYPGYEQLLGTVRESTGILPLPPQPPTEPVAPTSNTNTPLIVSILPIFALVLLLLGL